MACLQTFSQPIGKMLLRRGALLGLAVFLATTAETATGTKSGKGIPRHVPSGLEKEPDAWHGRKKYISSAGWTRGTGGLLTTKSTQDPPRTPTTRQAERSKTSADQAELQEVTSKLAVAFPREPGLQTNFPLRHRPISVEVPRLLDFVATGEPTFPRREATTSFRPTFADDNVQLVTGLNPRKMSPLQDGSPGGSAHAAVLKEWKKVVLRTLRPASIKKYGIEPENLDIVQLRGPSVSRLLGDVVGEGYQDMVSPFCTMRAAINTVGPRVYDPNAVTPEYPIFHVDFPNINGEDHDMWQAVGELGAPTFLVPDEATEEMDQVGVLGDEQMASEVDVEEAAADNVDPVEVLRSQRQTFGDAVDQLLSETAKLDLWHQKALNRLPLSQYPDIVNLWFPLFEKAERAPLGFVGWEEQEDEPSRSTPGGEKEKMTTTRLWSANAPAGQGRSNVVVFVEDMSPSEAWVFSSVNALHGGIPTIGADKRRFSCEIRFAVFDKSKWTYETQKYSGGLGTLAFNWKLRG